MDYKIFIDGKHISTFSEPLTQVYLRDYINRNSLRLKGIDFAGDVKYIFEKEIRKRSDDNFVTSE